MSWKPVWAIDTLSERRVSSLPSVLLMLAMSPGASCHRTVLRKGPLKWGATGRWPIPEPAVRPKYVYTVGIYSMYVQCRGAVFLCTGSMYCSCWLIIKGKAG